jgi:hypothetical protein
MAVPAPGTRERARTRVEEILKEPATALPSAEVMDRIRNEIPGIDTGVI